MREFEKAGVAATDARLDPDLTIMARTDALTVEGIDRAIERMQRYLEAGAGMAFIEAPESEEQMRRITREIPAPSMANMVPGGRTPLLDAARLQELGFACVAHPTALSYTLARAARELLDELNAKGTTSGFEDRMLNFSEFNRVIGLDEIRERETKWYGQPALPGTSSTCSPMLQDESKGKLTMEGQRVMEGTQP